MGKMFLQQPPTLHVCALLHTLLNRVLLESHHRAWEGVREILALAVCFSAHKLGQLSHPLRASASYHLKESNGLPPSVVMGVLRCYRKTRLNFVANPILAWDWYIVDAQLTEGLMHPWSLSLLPRNQPNNPSSYGNIIQCNHYIKYLLLSRG